MLTFIPLAVAAAAGDAKLICGTPEALIALPVAGFVPAAISSSAADMKGAAGGPGAPGAVVGAGVVAGVEGRAAPAVPPCVTGQAAGVGGGGAGGWPAPVSTTPRKGVEAVPSVAPVLLAVAGDVVETEKGDGLDAAPSLLGVDGVAVAAARWLMPVRAAAKLQGSEGSGSLGRSWVSL